MSSLAGVYLGRLVGGPDRAVPAGVGAQVEEGVAAGDHGRHAALRRLVGAADHDPATAGQDGAVVVPGRQLAAAPPTQVDLREGVHLRRGTVCNPQSERGPNTGL